MKRILPVFAFAAMCIVPVRAANLTWTTDGSGNWSNGGGGWTSTGGATTWSNATPDSAAFGNGGTAGAVSLTSGITATGVTFNTVTGNYLIQNNTLTLSNGGAITVNDDSATINSVIAGVGPVKSGTGNLNLGGANTFTGTFSINAGIVDVGGAGQALGLGSVVVNSAELAGGNSSASNIFNSVSSITLNSGTVRTRDSGNRTFGGNFAATGTSTFVIQKNNTSDNQVHTYGNLSIGTSELDAISNAFSGGNAGAAFGATTLTGNPTFNPINNVGSSTSLSIALGALNDSGTARTITKIGTGALTFQTNATSLVAGTQINVTQGTLNSSAATATGTMAQISVSSGATLTINTSAQTISTLSGTGAVTLNAGLSVGNGNTTSIFAGIIGGGSGLTKVGTGNLTLTGSNTFSGVLSVGAGTLIVPTLNNASTAGPLGNSGSAVVLGGTNGTAGTLQYTGATVSSSKNFNLGSGGSVVTSGTGVFQVDDAAATVTLSGAIGGWGAMVKTGSGTLLINNGGNTMQTAIVVNGGKLQVSGANGNGDPTSGVLGSYKNGSGARTITINDGGTMEFLTGNIFGTSGANNYVSFVINNGGLLTSGTVAGSNFFQNLLTINGGTLTTGNGVDVNNQSYRLNNNVTTGGSTVSTINAGGSSFNGINLRNGSATTFTVSDATGDDGADLIVSASLVNSSGGNGQVTKAGAGTMLLSGSNSYTSTTAVSAGVLQLGHASALGTVSGSTTVAAGAALDLNGQTIGAEPMNISGTGINNGGALINANTGTAASLAGNVTLTGTSSIGGAGNLTVTGTLIGAAATNRLVKTGTGTLTLTGTAGSNRGASTATTQIDGGVLRLNNALALNTSVSTGTATVNNGGTLELGNGITYNQGVALNDGGAFRSDGNNTFGTGGGVIGVANTGSPSVTLATVSLSDVFAINGRISGGTSTSTINISGPGNVDVLGSSNDYVGNWKVNAGVLRLGATAALGAGTSPTITLNGGSVAGRLASNTTFTPSNSVVVTADSGLLSDRSASGAGVTYTFGPLSIGSNQLAVSTSAAATSGTGGIVVGTTTLSGNPTFNVTNGATAATSFTAGALNDSGVARTITKSGNGTMTLGTAATSLVNGTQVNVTGGTLNSNHATALGNLAAVSVSGGANLVVGTSQTVGSLSGAGGVNISANTLTVGSSNNLSSTYAGAIAGTGGNLTKAGSGTLTLSGTSTYTGATTVNAGTLLVASTGRLNNTSGVTVASGGDFVYNNNTIPFAGAVTVTGVLGGNGHLAGTINGSGLVGPGNSPGVLTVGQIDGSGGLDFAFEFTSTGSPNYGNNVASVNDVLRTTDGTPFTSALDSNNTINVYLNVASITGGDIFKGGFYTDTNADFFSSISAATYQYYVANIAGAITYNGVNYDLYTGPLTISVATVSETADFGGGDVNGWVTEFTVVPEPTTWMLAGVGAMAVLFGRRRRA